MGHPAKIAGLVELIDDKANKMRIIHIAFRMKSGEHANVC